MINKCCHNLIKNLLVSALVRSMKCIRLFLLYCLKVHSSVLLYITLNLMKTTFVGTIFSFSEVLTYCPKGLTICQVSGFSKQLLKLKIGPTKVVVIKFNVIYNKNSQTKHRMVQIELRVYHFVICSSLFRRLRLENIFYDFYPIVKCD